MIILICGNLTSASSYCRGRNLFADCSNPSNYFDSYEESCVENRLVDGIEAEWIFIRNRKIGVSMWYIVIMYDITILNYV